MLALAPAPWTCPGGRGKGQSSKLLWPCSLGVQERYACGCHNGQQQDRNYACHVPSPCGWCLPLTQSTLGHSPPDVKYLKFPIDPEPGPRYRGPGSADLTLHLGQSRFRRCTLALPALAVAGLRSHRREACTSGLCCTARMHRSTVYPACSPVLCTRSCSSPCGWFVNTQL